MRTAAVSSLSSFTLSPRSYLGISRSIAGRNRINGAPSGKGESFRS
jgi:hypothetical protein